MIYPNAHLQHMVYKNGGMLIGVAKVTMPEIKYKSVNAFGAGLMGDFTVPLAGMIEPMLVKFEFSSVADATVELGSNEWHDIAVYVVDQYFDSDQRTEELDQLRFEMTVRPTEVSHGTIAAASPADASGTYSVCRYAVYKNGEKVIEIDPLNQVHMVNGKDCSANVRKLLGMS